MTLPKHLQKVHSRKKEFYDQGWNDFIKGEPLDPLAKRDWKDGWLDCKLAHEQEAKVLPI